MWSTPLLVTLIVAPTTPGRGESSVGVTGGLTLSGDQDVKIVEPRVGSTESHDVTAALGPVGGTTASLWLTHFGLQVDGLYWGTSTPGVLPRSLKPVRVGQDRGAVLGSFTGRVFLDEQKFAYGGLGCGLVAIGVRPGQTNVVPGLGAILGVALPITSRLRLRAEALSYDVKANDKVVTTLRSGGYSPYVVRPGLLELWARTASRQSSYRHTTPPPERANPDLLRLKAIDDAAKSAVTLDVKAGQVYYVKGEAGVRYFVGRPRLQVVSPEQGAGEIRQCTLIRDETREARD